MKKLVIFVLLIFAVILCRNLLFNTFFRYEVTGGRKIFALKDKAFKSEIENNGDAGIEEIVKNALDKTSSTLEFSFGKCDNDPNLLIKTKKANCIGYSAFLASSIQDLLDFKRMNDEWKVSHKVGEIYFLNENVNKHFSSKFFRDHDFVVLENKKTKEIIAIDGSLHDYFKIDKIKLK